MTTPIYFAVTHSPNGTPLDLAVRRVRSVCCDRPMFAEDARCPECRKDQNPFLQGQKLTTDPNGPRLQAEVLVPLKKDT